MTQKNSNNEQSTAPTDWWTEIDAGLKWLRKYMLVLGGIAFFITAIYLFNFAWNQNVSLSITSPSVLAAWPMLFALISFIVFALVAFIMAPAFTLLTPVTRDGLSLMADLRLSPADGEAERKRRIRILLFWLLVLFAVWLLLIVMALSIAKSESGLTGFVVFCIGFVVILFGMWLLVSIFGRQWFKSSDPDSIAKWRFLLVSFVGLLMQTLLVLVLYLPARAIISDETIGELYFWGMYAGLVVVLGCAQLIFSGMIIEILHQRGILKAAILTSLTIIALPGIFPDVGGRLTGFAFEVTASGGRNNCVILDWSDNAPSRFASLGDQPLRILFEAEGTYQVRLREAATDKAITTYFVPREAVAGMTACPK